MFNSEEGLVSGIASTSRANLVLGHGRQKHKPDEKRNSGTYMLQMDNVKMLCDCNSNIIHKELPWGI